MDSSEPKVATPIDSSQPLRRLITYTPSAAAGRQAGSHRSFFSYYIDNLLRWDFTKPPTLARAFQPGDSAEPTCFCNNVLVRHGPHCNHGSMMYIIHCFQQTERMAVKQRAGPAARSWQCCITTSTSSGAVVPQWNIVGKVGRSGHPPSVSGRPWAQDLQRCII